MQRLLAALLFALLLGGCSTTEAPRKEAEKPKNEYVTGRVAFQKLLVQAHLWQPDAGPYAMESQYTKDAPVLEGRAGVWRGRFASPRHGAVKAYLWSGVTSSDAPEAGINPSAEDTYSPTNLSTQPFDLVYLKKDSSDALTVAQAHGGKKLTDKDPKQPIIFQLDWNPRTTKLIWHVVYGDSLPNAKLRVAVDATTGDFQAIEK
jgi:hypothetical protein